MRTPAILLFALACTSPLHAYCEPGTIVKDLRFQISDLVFKAEPLGGAVSDLKVKETDQQIQIDLPGDVLFDFDKADIRAEAEPVLSRVAEMIRALPSASGRIEGYTDSKGDDAYNLKLSRKRAESVKQWLARNGNVQDKKFSTYGFGEKNPVAPNTTASGEDDPAGRQQNRRVQIIIKKR